MRHQFQTGEGVGLHNPPWEDNSAPWSEPHDSNLKDTYKSNAAIILERDRERSVHSVYNLPLTNAFTIPQLMTRVQDIYERQQYAFRLNLEFGLILRHTETVSTAISNLFPTIPYFNVPFTCLDDGISTDWNSDYNDSTSPISFLDRDPTHNGNLTWSPTWDSVSTISTIR